MDSQGVKPGQGHATQHMQDENIQLSGNYSPIYMKKESQDSPRVGDHLLDEKQ